MYFLYKDAKNKNRLENGSNNYGCSVDNDLPPLQEARIVAGIFETDEDNKKERTGRIVIDPNSEGGDDETAMISDMYNVNVPVRFVNEGNKENEGSDAIDSAFVKVSKKNDKLLSGNVAV